MSDPLVSILMPVYNGGRFLSRAVSSVTSQSARDFELLIIDDGSTDDSATQVAGFSDPRIRLLKNEKNRGLVQTLNRGLSEARGEWIARCDSDDLWLPSKLEIQLAHGAADSKVALIGTNATLIDENDQFRGQFRTPASHEALCWDLCFRNPFVHSTVLFRRAVAQELGGYHDIPAAEDYDLWSRMAAKHRLASVPQALVRYRLHGSSVMAKENAEGRKKSYEYLKAIMQKNLEGIAAPDIAKHLDAWLEPAREKSALRQFWQAYATGWTKYRSTHSRLSCAGMVVGEHLQSMLYRQRCFSRANAFSFLQTLDAAQLLALPKLRALATLALPA